MYVYYDWSSPCQLELDLDLDRWTMAPNAHRPAIQQRAPSTRLRQPEGDDRNPPEVHIGQINMEIKRLRAVRSQYTAKISAFESDLRTIRNREAKADDKDRIVQELREEMRAFKADRDTRQAALDAREAARDKDIGDEDVATAEDNTL